MYGQVCAFWKVLSQQSVGVFICAALPRAVWFTQEDVNKLGPALAAGCTVVAKPAAATPYSALAWGVLAQEVGFPDGVLNILTGSAREIGGAIMASPDVRKVTFTGSTEVGKTLNRQSADTVKKVSMELGGNAPFIVFEDADIDAAVEGAMVSKYRNMGQTCVCTNRFYVQEKVYDTFVEKLLAATRPKAVKSRSTANAIHWVPLSLSQRLSQMPVRT